MKTLYIDINNTPIANTPELEVLSIDLKRDFYYSLGESIKGRVRGVSSNIDLIEKYVESGESTKFIEDAFKTTKEILFSDNPEEDVIVSLPQSYLEWLRYNNNDSYRNIYEQLYSVQSRVSVTINMEELYEDAISGTLYRKIRKYLKDDVDIEEFVFNDNCVNRKSAIVRKLKEDFEDVGFIPFEKLDKQKDAEVGKIKQKDEESKEKITNDEIFICACDRMDDNDGKWFSEFYTKDGRALGGIYEHINGRTTFLFSNGNYYYIENRYLKEISLNECKGATVYDEENADFEILILKNKNGFFVINNEGQISIPIGLYSEIRYAYDDCVLAQKKGLWGVISLNNEILIDFLYNGISAIIRRGKRFYLIEDENGKVGVINGNGNLIVSPKYDEVDCLVGDDGSLWFKVCQDDEWLYGIIDENENIIIPTVYDDVEILFDYHNRENPMPPFFKVKDGDESGVIDSDGEFVIPFDNYEDIQFDSSYNYILASYEDAYEYDYLEHRCNWINPPFVYEIPDEYCVYDKNGLRVVQECPYSCRVEKMTRSLKNKNGRIIYSSYCDGLYHHGECYIAEQRNENDFTTYTIIGANGKVLGKIPKGFRATDFVGGMALCFHQKKDETCIVNLNGRVVKILPRSEKSYLPPFQEGKLFFVENNGDIGYYDQSLSKNITCNCKEVEQLKAIMQDGLLSVLTKKGNWGLLHYYTGKLIEFEGLERIDCLYGNWDVFTGRRTLIHDYFNLRHENGKYTLIDKNGNLIIKKEFALIGVIL